MDFFNARAAVRDLVDTERGHLGSVGSGVYRKTLALGGALPGVRILRKEVVKGLIMFFNAVAGHVKISSYLAEYSTAFIEAQMKQVALA